MMQISLSQYMEAFDFIKSLAVKSLTKKNYNNCLVLVERCAKIAYTLNFKYSDTELENILFEVGKVLGTTASFDGIPKKIALIDTNGSDSHGLTQQYLRAFMDADVELLYIYEDPDLSRIEIIRSELEVYTKASILTFSAEVTNEDKIRAIVDRIGDFKPEKLFLHIMPWDVVAVTVCSIVNGCSIYNINATDHAFWLGTSFIDYNIEFRDFGYTLSIIERGLRPYQLIMLPYYPVLNRMRFNGLPEADNVGKVKIFSGGAIYKVLGDNDRFFKLVTRLLSENPNAMLYFAGGGENSTFMSLLEKYSLTQRVCFLGNRTDIVEVFDNCDIYLGTYPISGGLMSQIAAVLSKPILAFAGEGETWNDIEGLVCHNNNICITHRSIEAFFEDANKLCSNVDERARRGAELNSSMITEAQFNTEISLILSGLITNRTGKIIDINLNRFKKVYLEVENDYVNSALRIIVSPVQFKLLAVYPLFFIKALCIFIKRKINKWLA